jgi:hypothetical protein
MRNTVFLHPHLTKVPRCLQTASNCAERPKTARFSCPALYVAISEPAPHRV